MAPSTFLASTPMSRRTRRKLQKGRRRTRQPQNASDFWTPKKEIATSERQDWFRAARPLEHTAASTSTLFGTSKFEPELKCGLSTSKVYPRYSKHMLTRRGSNPFSLLDVQIPSPSLFISSSPQAAPFLQTSDHGHDMHSIGFNKTVGLPTPPPEAVVHRNLHQDEWASSVQRESIATRSYDPLVRDSAQPKQDVVEMPTAGPANHVPIQHCWGPPATQQESGIVRIPSPLLYHRRSEGVSTEALVEPQLACTQPDPALDKYNSKDTCLMSELRGAGQEKHSAQPTQSAFVAAKLPLMDEALSADQSADGGVSLQYNLSIAPSSDKSPSAASYSPPNLATKNTCIIPKRVYHVVCQPNSPWSGPACYTLHPSWGLDQDLVFPKLSIPGHKPQHNSKSSPSKCSDQGLILRPSQPIKYASLTTAVPASVPALPESRKRSSTQHSFDSKFDVATATRKFNVPGRADSGSANAKIQSWQTISPADSTAVVGSSAVAEKYHLAHDTNTAADDEFPMGAQPVEKMVDWLFDDLDSQFLVHPEQRVPQKDAFAVENEDHHLTRIGASEADEKANEV